MTEKEIHKVFESITDKLCLKSKYAEVCKLQSDFDNCKGITKSQAKELKSKHNIDFKLSGKDRMFYQDYEIGKITIRLMVPYGHGMIDSSYRVFGGMTDNTFPSFSYRRLAESNKVKNDDHILTFPTNTSLEEFENILLLISDINEEIIKILKSELEENNEL